MSIDTENEGPAGTDVTAPARQTKVWIAIVVAGVLAGIAIAWYVVANGDDEAPYTDPAATGTLTFCTQDGTEVTEGSIKDAPFADLAVGSTTAGAAYAEAGNGTLYAYQPRAGVAADEFSGLQLTAARPFADPKHPSAQITDESTTLSDFVAGYPADLDGYLQLRLLLTAPGTAAQVDHYDTADLRVDGGTWRLVNGGSGDCKSASKAAKTATDGNSVTP